MSDKPFVHLHCHTDSLLDGACEIGQLMDLVVEQKMPLAVAMTGPREPFFGAVEFYNKAKEKGCAPGHRMRSVCIAAGPGERARSETDRYNHLVLLCETQDGYRKLC